MGFFGRLLNSWAGVEETPPTPPDDRFTRDAIIAALREAGFPPRTNDAPGFGVTTDGARFKVHCGGGSSADRAVIPDYAVALREAGFKARVSFQDGQGGEFVSVTGLKP